MYKLKVFLSQGDNQVDLFQLHTVACVCHGSPSFRFHRTEFASLSIKKYLAPPGGGAR